MNMTTTHPLGEHWAACTGCAACSAICPNECISMVSDVEGFLHPQINQEFCSNCGLCRKVCPVYSEISLPETQDLIPDRITPPKVFAAWNLNDDIRRESSSGGIFTVLAEHVLSQEGVILGAAFNEELVVRHIQVESSEELGRLRGSKYVQSEITPSLLHQTRDFLEHGRLVLFSGTPCQTAGVRHFLRRPYKTLFCCDIICHGVPSPLLLKRYIEYCRTTGRELINISFRDKEAGWKQFGVRQYFANGRNYFRKRSADPYGIAYSRNLCYRPACYKCTFTSTVRWGDLTIGDFWGVSRKYPEYDTDDKGTSLLFVNTTKGEAWLDECKKKIFLGGANIDTAIGGNPQLTKPSHCPSRRDTFYRDLESITFRMFIRKYRLQPVSFLYRLMGGFYRRLRRVLRRNMCQNA